MNRTETIVKKIVRQNIRKMNISCPAKVVGIDNLKDGYIDVLPLVNEVHEITKDSYEQPQINRVRVIYPSTKTSTICFPVNLGDFVQLEFQSVNIEKFLNGNEDQHDPSFNAFMNRSDVVAKVGFEPYQKSCMNPNNYSNDFNNQDLNIVHNKNTDREVTFSLTQDGGVKVISSGEVNIKCNTATVDATEIDAVNALVKTNNDVEIKGVSVYQHMTTHTHPYTDDGSPMTTSPANPL